MVIKSCCMFTDKWNSHDTITQMVYSIIKVKNNNNTNSKSTKPYVHVMHSPKYIHVSDRDRGGGGAVRFRVRGMFYARRSLIACTSWPSNHFSFSSAYPCIAGGYGGTHVWPSADLVILDWVKKVHNYWLRKSGGGANLTYQHAVFNSYLMHYVGTMRDYFGT